MLENQRKKLSEYSDGDYVSIGITSDGEERRMISVPWESTGHAMNMKIPDLYLSPPDLLDGEIRDALARLKVIGCYIFTPLEYYGFLESFTELYDLFIRCDGARLSLDFLPSLSECVMLSVYDAVIDSLDPLVEAKKKSSRPLGAFRCVSFALCRLGGVSRLSEEKLRFSELIIAARLGEDTKERWSAVNAGTKRFYTI